MCFAPKIPAPQYIVQSPPPPPPAPPQQTADRSYAETAQANPPPEPQAEITPGQATRANTPQQPAIGDPTATNSANSGARVRAGGFRASTVKTGSRGIQRAANTIKKKLLGL